MKITSVKGTNDYLPKEVLIRDYLQSVILETYQSCGFERIMTPILEDIENLDKSEGGENLGLIYKILKRGDKLEKAINSNSFNELSDIGLRYDLTLPLSRYYANNRSKLIVPFKCIQIDKVYRAERPQKGRLREFVQCDIDIIGNSSICAEMEAIDTTAKALINIGISDFKVKINDRRLLRNILMNLGFIENQLESVSIIFDKLDKIGATGVREELVSKGFLIESIDKLLLILKDTPFTIESARKYCKDDEIINNLEIIINMVSDLSDGKYTIEYDMSLVRGQGYYTGTVFEIESANYRGAIAGGGRYDNLIGKFLNETVPAVGFSIGFERIYGIMIENNFEVPRNKKMVAVFYDFKDFNKAMLKAEDLRTTYNVTLFEKPNKIGKLLDKLKTQGYYAFYIQGQSDQLSILEMNIILNKE